jgi:hypothetical protein
MADFTRQDLRGSRFERVLLGEARFESVDLGGAQFRAVNFSDTRLRAVAMRGVVMRGVELVDTDINGEIQNVTINGVDIGPLVDIRTAPRCGRRTPKDSATRGRRSSDCGTAPSSVHARSIPNFCTNRWAANGRSSRRCATSCSPLTRGSVARCSATRRQLDLPWDEMPDTPGVPRDRDARPSLDEVLELRRDRIATVRDVIGALTDESLLAHTKPVDAPRWPAPVSFPVRQCLSCILNEEWEHRLYAERDLDALSAR